MRWPTKSRDEFPVEEYSLFIDGIALNIKQGAPLVATLGDMRIGQKSKFSL